MGIRTVDINAASFVVGQDPGYDLETGSIARDSAILSWSAESAGDYLVQYDVWLTYGGTSGRAKIKLSSSANVSWYAYRADFSDFQSGGSSGATVYSNNYSSSTSTEFVLTSTEVAALTNGKGVYVRGYYSFSVATSATISLIHGLWTGAGGDTLSAEGFGSMRKFS